LRQSRVDINRPANGGINEAASRMRPQARAERVPEGAI
jgi:hypothetical protein